MEEIKFNTEFLNEYFRQVIGKEKFYLEDIKRLPELIINANYAKITQHDFDILLNNIPSVQLEGFDLRGLTVTAIVINNWNAATEEEIEKFNNIGLGSILVNSFKSLTTEIIDKLNENFKYFMIRDALANRKHYTYYTKQDMKDILLKMEKIKKLIPDDATDLEKFMTIYKALGMKATYDFDGDSTQDSLPQNFSQVKARIEAERITRSLKGVLIDGKAVCEGFAWSLQKCLDYVGIEARCVAGRTSRESNHEWNQVKIDEEWYNVDLTKDSINIKNKAPLEYCLRSDEYFKEKGYIPDGYRKDIDELEALKPMEQCWQDYFMEEIEDVYSELNEYYENFGKISQRRISLREYKENAENREIDKNILNDIKEVVNSSQVIEI